MKAHDEVPNAEQARAAILLGGGEYGTTQDAGRWGRRRRLGPGLSLGFPSGDRHHGAVYASEQLSNLTSWGHLGHWEWLWWPLQPACRAGAPLPPSGSKRTHRGLKLVWQAPHEGVCGGKVAAALGGQQCQSPRLSKRLADLPREPGSRGVAAGLLLLSQRPGEGRSRSTEPEPPLPALGECPGYSAHAPHIDPERCHTGLSKRQPSRCWACDRGHLHLGVCTASPRSLRPRATPAQQARGGPQVVRVRTQGRRNLKWQVTLVWKGAHQRLHSRTPRSGNS